MDGIRKWVKRIFLVLVSSFLALVLAEVVLGITGYKIDTPPIIIEGDKPGKIVKKGAGLVSDAELRWKFKPGEVVWSNAVNTMGYREREVNPVKTPGTVRVICLGDSCTVMGEPPYSRILHSRLTNSPPDSRQWEAFNMGVFGYSSSQGLRDFQAKAAGLQPDFVTIYYGWNDHWFSGLSKPDSMVMAVKTPRWKARLIKHLQRRRVGQLLVRVLGAMPTQQVRSKDCYRTPPEEYVANLQALIKETRTCGGVPILMTAPYSGRLWQGLVEKGNIQSVEQGGEAHEQYAELTRKVAMQEKVVLIDLAAKYPGHPELFNEDGIHPTQKGFELIANDIYDAILQVVSVKEPPVKGNAP